MWTRGDPTCRDSPQRQRDHRGGSSFLEAYDLDFILRALCVWVPKRIIPRLGALSVVNIRATTPRCPVSFRQQTQTWAPWGIWGTRCGSPSKCAKQTQFPARHVADASPPFQAEAYRAKQRQAWATWSIWGTASRVLYKQTQFGGTPAAACRLGPARAGCTNKPKSAGSRRGSPYKQTQFALAGWAGEAVVGAYCAKQTQFGPGPCEGQILYGKGVMVDYTCRGLRQNKANSRRGRAILPRRSPLRPLARVSRLYKQTQFGVFSSDEGCPCEQTNPISGPVGPPRTPDRAKRTQSPAGRQAPTIPIFHHSSPMPFVQNKANLPQTGREDHRQGQRPWRCHPAEGNCVKTRGARQAGFRAQGLAHFPGIW
jgi:hypothetical protein